MSRYVVGLEEIDQAQVEVAGGKGANLGELTRIDGVGVPAGFVVTPVPPRRRLRDRPLGGTLRLAGSAL
jgi:rifampicin phosphotransferase